MPRTCAVATCINSETKLRKWGADICEKHHIAQKTCDCSWPFELRPFPSAEREPVIREEWIKQVYGKDWASSHERLEPNKEGRVCSQHFLPGDTVPSLNLGHSRKQVKKKSHPRRHNNSYATVKCHVKEEKNPDVEPPPTPRSNSDVGYGHPSQAKMTTTLFPSNLRPNRCSLPSMTENTARMGKDGQCRVAEERLLIIGNEFAECWSSVGTNEGLHSDISIAKFLLDMYKDRCSSSTPMAKDNIHSAAMCRNCCTNLILYCPTCQQPSQKQPVQHPSSQTSLSQKQTLQDSSVRNPPLQSTSSWESTANALSLQNSSLQGLAVQRRPWQKVFVQKTHKKTDVNKSSQKGVLPVQVADSLSKGGQFLAQPQTSSVAVPVALHKAGSSHTLVQLAGTASPSGLTFSQISDDVKEEAVNCDTEAFGVLSEEGEDRMDRTEGSEVDVCIKREPGIDDVEPLVVRPSCKPTSENSNSFSNCGAERDNCVFNPVHTNADSSSTSAATVTQKIILVKNLQDTTGTFQRVQPLRLTGKESETKDKTVIFIQSSLPVAQKEHSRSAQGQSKMKTARAEEVPRFSAKNKKAAKRTYLCKFCGIVYQSYSSLNFHRKAKHSEKVYTCTVCGLQSQCESRLRKHTSKCKGMTSQSRRLLVKQQQMSVKKSVAASGRSAARRISEQVTTKSSRQTVSGNTDNLAIMEPLSSRKGEQRLETPGNVTPPLETTVQKIEESTSEGVLHNGNSLVAETKEESWGSLTLDRTLHDTVGQEDDLTGLPIHFAETAGIGGNVNSNTGTKEQFQKNYECKLCGSVYRSCSALQYHKRAKHSGKVYTCDRCDMQTQYKSRLRMHASKCKGQSSVATLVSETSVGDESLFSDKTVDGVASPANTATGMSAVTAEAAADSSGSMKNDGGKKTGRKAYMCNFCGAVYGNYSSWNCHRKAKHSGKEYTCNICGLQSRYKTRINRHARKCKGLTYRNRNLIADRQMQKALKMSSITCEAPSVEVTTEQVTAKPLPAVMGPGSKEAVSHSQAVASSEPVGAPTSVVDFKTATEPSQTNPPSAPANTLLGLAEAVTLTLRQQAKSEVVSTSRKVEESALARTTFVEAGSTIKPAEDSGSDLTCDICGKVCPSLFKLRFHKREKHDPEPLWKHRCQECDMSFKEKRSFEAHMNNHRGLKPFSCSLCGSCFASSVSLRHHLKRCRNRKPREYVTHHCDSCDKSFKEKRQFDAHMNSHLGVKPFLCSQCGMSYAHDSYLRRHQRRCRAGQPRTYVKYHCDECDQSFKEKRQFEGHMNKHRGLKPFLCSQCGMCFASSMDLKNHRQTCGKTLSGTNKKKKKKKETGDNWW